MSELKELIQNYPGLGDAFAEIENRLSFLENSLPFTQLSPTGETPKDPQWSRRQWDAVTQLKGFILKLQNDLNKHIDKSKPKEKQVKHKGIEI